MIGRSRQHCIKRAIDIVVAGGALLLLSPIIAIVAILILLKMGRPVLFRQQRPGLNSELFEVVKFRTMREAEDSNAAPLSDGTRLTSLGRLLRRTSLDELPQLWTVARGDMSLVGPRPLLIRYQPYFTEAERMRFAVKPGITGWAQLHGRNTISWSERFEYDVWYVEHWSIRLDIKILIMTIGRVFRGRGVVTDARSLMKNLDEERGQIDEIQGR